MIKSLLVAWIMQKGSLYLLRFRKKSTWFKYFVPFYCENSFIMNVINLRDNHWVVWQWFKQWMVINKTNIKHAKWWLWSVEYHSNSCHAYFSPMCRQQSEVFFWVLFCSCAIVKWTKLLIYHRAYNNHNRPKAVEQINYVSENVRFQ